MSGKPQSIDNLSVSHYIRDTMYRKLLSVIAPACHLLERNVAHQLHRSGAFKVRAFRQVLQGRFLSIMRSDLARLIYQLGGEGTNSLRRYGYPN
jgi:hypothetical protein